MADNQDDFIEQLRASYWSMDQEKRARFDRSVSFGDMVGDRTKRAETLGFGSGTTIYDSALVLGQVSVGRNCWIGPSSILDGTGGLSIGDYVTVSFGVMIASHSSLEHMLSGGKCEIRKRATTIGNRSVLGPGSFIDMGLTIGDGVVVAPHSVIMRNVPSGLIVKGHPAKRIGKVQYKQDGSPLLVLDKI